MALRDSPKIALTTRTLVQATARDLGYRPDPGLRHLASRLHAHRPRSFQAPVLALCNSVGRSIAPAIKNAKNALTQRLTELGYSSELVEFPHTAEEVARLGRTIHTRRVAGLIFMPRLDTGHCDYTPALCGTVSILSLLTGTSALADAVIFNWRHTINLTLREVRSRGFRRIGVIFPHVIDRLSDHAITAVIVHHATAQTGQVEIRGFPLPEVSIETLKNGLLDHDTQHPYPAPQLATWFQQFQPDTIVVVLEDFAKPVLLTLAPVAPADLPIFIAGKRPDSPYSGCVHDYERLGILAAELLDAKIRSGQTGLTSPAAHFAFDGVWTEPRKTAPSTPGPTGAPPPADTLRS